MGQLKALTHADWQRRLDEQLGFLKLLTADCRNLMDLGCGPSSPISAVHGPWRVGVDGWAASIEKARENSTHDELVCRGVLDFLRESESCSVDAVLALDVIEHMERPLGLQLLTEMERVARKRVVVATPNGFLRQDGGDNPLQRHVSGWSPPEFMGRGYRVEGLYGLKWLRGEGHELLFSSRTLFRASWATSSFVRKHARLAAGLICHKSVGAFSGVDAVNAHEPILGHDVV